MDEFQVKLDEALFRTKHCFALFDIKDDLLEKLDQITRKLNIPIMAIGIATFKQYNYNCTTEDIDIVTSSHIKLRNILIKHFKLLKKDIFKYKGIRINCLYGNKYPKLESKISGLSYASLPLVLSLKIKSKRYTDLVDYIELIKRNKLTIKYIKEKVYSYLNISEQIKANRYWKEAIREIKGIQDNKLSFKYLKEDGYFSK